MFENKLVSSVISETSVGSVGLDVARLLSVLRQSPACNHFKYLIRIFITRWLPGKLPSLTLDDLE